MPVGRTAPGRTLGLIIVSILTASAMARVLLLVAPQAGRGIGGIHVHHLLVGVVLMGIGGIPMALVRSDWPGRTAAVSLFGFGLGLALDEWVLLVIREARPEEPYQSAASVVGALALLALSAAYAWLIHRWIGPPRNQIGPGTRRDR